MSETAVKKAITDRLEAHGYIVTRTAAGGYRGRTAGCKKGTPDLHVQGHHGRSVWLEIKATEKDKATREQVAFIEKARSFGAYAAVVWTPEQAEKRMRNAAEFRSVSRDWAYFGEESV